MIIDSLILFVCAVGGGLAVNIFKTKKIDIKSPLVFAGAYLFSLTVIHILPEIFETEIDHFWIGLCVLLGFFFQYFLEFFTSGVEHGHMHVHPEGHTHRKYSVLTLMFGLCVHSLLEGTLLAYPAVLNTEHQSHSLLIGVILHKIPAGLALMSVITCHYDRKNVQYLLLILFALASPVGLVVGNYLEPMGWVDTEGIIMLFAFVAGNFLHISTTIFVESSPDHNWNLSRILVTVSGALIAVMAEFLI